ncbi:MAG: CAP domain-containing protein [Betaproteobacteria bacterium]
MRKYRWVLVLIVGLLALNTIGYLLAGGGQLRAQTWYNWLWPRKPAPAPKPTPTPKPAPAPTPAPAPAPSPTPPATGYTLNAQEQQFLTLTNQNRTTAGLPALRSNLELSRMARIKAQDMVTNNYFSHYSPTYGYPPTMAQKFGIQYMYGVGENIVQSRNVSRANAQLMASPGHKANILDPRYTDIGVGVVSDGYGGIMGVQQFIGR